MAIACEQIRSEFSALLDEELNPEDRELVEEHLSECADCLRELHRYQQVNDAYRYHHPVKAPDDFEERLKHALAPPVENVRSFPVLWRYAAAAVVIVGVSFAAWRFSGSSENPMLLSKNEAMESAMPEAESQFAPKALASDGVAKNGGIGGGGGGVPSDFAPVPMRQQRVDETEPASPEVAPIREAIEEMGAIADEASPPPAPAAAPPQADSVEMREEKTDASTTSMAPSAPSTSNRADSETREAMPVEVGEAEARAKVSRSESTAGFPLEDQSMEADSEGSKADMEEQDRTAGRSRTSVSAKKSGPSALAFQPGSSRAPSSMPKTGGRPSASVPSPDYDHFEWREISFIVREKLLEQKDYDNEALEIVAVPSDVWTKLLEKDPGLTDLVDGTHTVIVQLDDQWYRFEPTALKD